MAWRQALMMQWARWLLLAVASAARVVSFTHVTHSRRESASESEIHTALFLRLRFCRRLAGSSVAVAAGDDGCSSEGGALLVGSTAGTAAASGAGTGAGAGVGAGAGAVGSGCAGVSTVGAAGAGVVGTLCSDGEASDGGGGVVGVAAAGAGGCCCLGGGIIPAGAGIKTPSTSQKTRDVAPPGNGSSGTEPGDSGAAADELAAAAAFCSGGSGGASIVMPGWAA